MLNFMFVQQVCTLIATTFEMQQEDNSVETFEPREDVESKLCG